MREKWTRIQSILEKRIGTSQLKVWIAPLVPAEEEGGLMLYAPSEFAATHVRNWFLPHCLEAARLVYGAECPVGVACRAGRRSAPAVPAQAALAAPAPTWRQAADNAPGSAPPQEATALSSTPPEAPALSSAPPEIPALRFMPAPRPLPVRQLGLPAKTHPAASATGGHSWRYSFEDFVVGPCNELAHAASRSICRDARNADVLFLCSAPGLGKTHLMHAVGGAVSASSNRAHPRVEYLTAEEFTSRFYCAIKGQDTDRFKARHRDIDLLLLEDVHFLQGKEKTQAELLATIKTLRDRGAKVVFTSSFAPKDLKQMDEQLQSRLCAGLLSFIERPDEETRRRILRRKASTHQELLSVEVEDLLVRHIQTDVRQIESCLHTLILKARLLNSRITPEMAWDVLAQYAAHSPVLDMESIIGTVCRGFHLTAEQLFSATRKQAYVCARNTVFFLARKHTDLSLESIGRLFNRRHSTVIKGITSLEREMSRQSPMGRQIAGTIAMIERNGNIVAPKSH